MTEDEMIGWYHRLNGHEFGQVLEDGEGQGSLTCCSSWGCKESDMTERLNNSNHLYGVSSSVFAIFLYTLLFNIPLLGPA